MKYTGAIVISSAIFSAAFAQSVFKQAQDFGKKQTDWAHDQIKQAGDGIKQSAAEHKQDIDNATDFLKKQNAAFETAITANANKVKKEAKNIDWSPLEDNWKVVSKGTKDVTQKVSDAWNAAAAELKKKHPAPTTPAKRINLGEITRTKEETDLFNAYASKLNKIRANPEDLTVDAASGVISSGKFIDDLETDMNASKIDWNNLDHISNSAQTLLQVAVEQIYSLEVAYLSGEHDPNNEADKIGNNKSYETLLNIILVLSEQSDLAAVQNYRSYTTVDWLFERNDIVATDLITFIVEHDRTGAAAKRVIEHSKN